MCSSIRHHLYRPAWRSGGAALLMLVLSWLWPVRQPAAAQATLTPIADVQGRGDSSPFVNRRVTVEGVVTGVRADRNAAGTVFYTLFLQSAPGSEDGDPATSDGLPVFLGRSVPTHVPGDLLRVSGRVTEYFGLTELDDADLTIELLASDVALPTPIAVAEFDGTAEALEGMLVTPGRQPAVVVGATHSGCGFAVLDATYARPFRRHVDDPVWPVLPVLGADETACDVPEVKLGDQISGLFGALTYDFGEYKIVLHDPAYLAITPAALPVLPPPPSPAADQFTLISFNLHDYFDDVDDGNVDEPLPDAAAVNTRRAQLAATIGDGAGCPTIVALQEVEHAALLQALSDALQPTCGFAYLVVHRETPDARGIDNGFLLDSRRVFVDRVALVQGCTALPISVIDPAANCATGTGPLFDRPPLVAELRIDGHPYTIINNHFKSKREGEAETAAWRLAQAQHVNALVAAADAQARVIVVGDLNDYERSAPLQALEAAGLHNALAALPDAERYTYVFDGLAQMLDYILLGPNVAPSLVAARILHFNADYPAGWSGPAAAGRPPLLRASDHDIPYVLIALPAPPIAVATPTPLPTVVPATLPPAPTDLPPVLTSTPTAPVPVDPGVTVGTAWWIAGVGVALIVGIALGWWLRRQR